MQTDKLTPKECAYLTYAYASTASLVLLIIGKTTGNLEKAIDFNPITSLAIVLNMVTFLSVYYYKKKIAHK